MRTIGATGLVVVALALAACGAGKPAGGAGVAAAKPAPREEPAEPQAMVAELVRLAGADDRAALDARVDWPWVRRLAALTEAFEPSLPGLVGALALPGGCAVEWRVDDGGLRLDFPPAMVDDDPRLAAEKDAVKAELYQGSDVVAVCGGREIMIVQVVFEPAAGWRVRGWARLAR